MTPDPTDIPTSPIPDFRAPQRITAEDLANRFTYHPPRDSKDVAKYELVRSSGHVLAAWMVGMCPPGREVSLAVKCIEESVMWANAAIARGQDASSG